MTPPPGTKCCRECASRSIPENNPGCASLECPCHLLNKVDQQVGGALRALGGDFGQEENGWEALVDSAQNKLFNLPRDPIFNNTLNRQRVILEELAKEARTSALRFALDKIAGLIKENEEESHKYEDCADIHLGRKEALSDVAQAFTSELTKS